MGGRFWQDLKEIGLRQAWALSRPLKSGAGGKRIARARRRQEARWARRSGPVVTRTIAEVEAEGAGR